MMAWSSSRFLQRPFFLLVCCYLSGIMAHGWRTWPVLGLFFIIPGLLCLGSFWRGGRQALIFYLPVFFCLGIVRMAASQRQPADDVARVARYYRQKPVAIQGLVISDPQRRKGRRGDKTSFVLRVSWMKTRWGWRRKDGKMLVNVYRDADVSYGDYLRLEGKIHRPFNFKTGMRLKYRDILRQSGISLMMSVRRLAPVEILARGRGNPFKSMVFRHRARLAQILRRHLAPQEAGILSAVLLGDRTDIADYISDLFSRTGTAHILAISGLHVGIMSSLFFLVLKLLPMRRSWHHFFTVLLIIYFVILTGARASVVRAGIMAIVFFLSYVLEREWDSLTALSLAAFIILAGTPAAFFSIGFQLSFAAVLAIIIYFPFFYGLYSQLSWAGEFKWVRYFLHSCALSFCAWLGVAGLIAYYFGIITPVAMLANFFVIPLTGLVVTLGLGLLAAGSLMPWAGMVFGRCLSAVLSLMIGIVYIFDKFPWAYFRSDNISQAPVFLYYAVLLIFACRIQRPRQ